jgi:hypothetical protein
VLAAIQVLVAPLIAAVEARAALAARLALRRAILLIAATLFGVGALLFLSVGIVFALVPAVGPAGAALIMALIWVMLAGFCMLFARLRPRSTVARVPVAAPPVVAPAPPVVAPAPAVGPPSASRFGSLRARISRTAPLLALGALVAGIIAGRR